MGRLSLNSFTTQSLCFVELELGAAIIEEIWLKLDFTDVLILDWLFRGLRVLIIGPDFLEVLGSITLKEDSSFCPGFGSLLSNGNTFLKSARLSFNT